MFSNRVLCIFVIMLVVTGTILSVASACDYSGLYIPPGYTFRVKGVSCECTSQNQLKCDPVKT
ncbi:hypothetical protein HOLleu_42630 [Holothuria leucospilota]|uniref:Uncharacterized protein n=1 Tax=Holothuria leucospilota TaxID=206669 RepID=A0A9Q0YCH8_HOLLE|nr:hypothetical protein HOLleu_42630 [Holothuria leucospilota]